MFLHGKHGDALRADLAERGWSAENDIPRRLAWPDAWALFTQLLTDPGSRVCASVGGMEYPADRLTLTVMGALGMQGPFGSGQRKASAEEIERVSRGMSSRFARLYKE